MSKICLCMIVKNESRVIRRCLESLLPVIDSWVISDTGSNDGTQEIIKDVLKDIPGTLIERPWVDYSHNRNEVIQEAKVFLRKKQHDNFYLYFIDADETLVQTGPDPFKDLTKGAYYITYKYGNLVYPRVSLVLMKQDWKYKDVLHEYLSLDGPFTTGTIENAHVFVRAEGARSSDPDKYKKDAEVLKKALETDPENSRYWFYLAQSYRDANMFDEAIQTYNIRVQKGGWVEETWHSLYQIARIMEMTKASFTDTLMAYLRAYEFRPHRAETLGCLARFLRLNNMHSSACAFAEQGMRTAPTTDMLFIETAYYEWICKDEFAIAAYWCGREEDGKEVNEDLLLNPALPEVERERIQKNLDFCIEKIKQHKPA